MVVNCKLFQQFQAMWCCYALKNKEKPHFGVSNRTFQWTVQKKNLFKKI